MRRPAPRPIAAQSASGLPSMTSLLLLSANTGLHFVTRTSSRTNSTPAKQPPRRIDEHGRDVLIGDAAAAQAGQEAGPQEIQAATAVGAKLRTSAGIAA